MILIDVNLLLYVDEPTAAEARYGARAWFEDQMNSGERVGLPWHSLVRFPADCDNR